MSKNPEDNDKMKTGDFGLPEGYFDKSALSIFNRIEWIEEHKQFPALVQLKKETGFIVPESYFESSEAELELLPYPELLKGNRASAFIVPENYFDEAEVKGLSAGISDENDELSQFDALNRIKKENVFEVTENYFELSAEKIQRRLIPPAKIINLFGAKGWFMSAAAVLTISLGIWLYNLYFNTSETRDCGTLACVDRIDLVKANKEYLDEDELYKTVDANKLEEKLNGSVSSLTEDKADSSTKIKTEDLLDEI